MERTNRTVTGERGVRDAEGLAGMRPLVTAVIPTTGRPELGRAIRSVLAQTIANVVEIVVIADLADGALERPAPLREGDVVAFTGGSKGGGYARNLGVQSASGTWIAFLDDDDAWLPSKLELQVAAAEKMAARGLHPLVGTRHFQVDVHSGRRSKAIPKVPYDGNQTIAEYLFRRRRPGGGRASLYTSTLLVERQTARKYPWDTRLRRHQDWDWVLRLESEGRLTITQLEEPLVVIYAGSEGSISATNNWRDSVSWADATLQSQNPGVYEDFLVAQSLRYAIGARSGCGVWQILSRLASRRRFPAIGPVLIAVAGLLPRRWLQALMARVR